MNEKIDGGSVEINNDLAIQILDQLPTPVMAVDLDLSLIFMNEAGLKLSGKRWEEIKGRHCYEIFDSLTARHRNAG